MILLGGGKQQDKTWLQLRTRLLDNYNLSHMLCTDVLRRPQ